jgi:hypothetical protein
VILRRPLTGPTRRQLPPLEEDLSIFTVPPVLPRPSAQPDFVEGLFAMKKGSAAAPPLSLRGNGSCQASLSRPLPGPPVGYGVAASARSSGRACFSPAEGK